MKIFKKILFQSLLAITFITPVILFADNTIAGSIPNPFNCGGSTTNCDLITFITTVLNNVVMPIAAVAVVVWIVWAGFSYVMAQGNPAKIKEAHQRLLWSLIGGGILLGAAAISAVVQTTVTSLLH